MAALEHQDKVMLVVTLLKKLEFMVPKQVVVVLVPLVKTQINQFKVVQEVLVLLLVLQVPL
jgi:hypothetical protein